MTHGCEVLTGATVGDKARYKKITVDHDAVDPPDIGSITVMFSPHNSRMAVRHPREVLFADDAGEPGVRPHAGRACGFYWTEGIRGLGWAVDAIPTTERASE